MDTIRLVSWNVNGFRALSGKPDWDWFASTDADVVALQETKAEPAQIAEEHRSPEGWNAEWLAAQVKKGYSGVAVFSRQKAALEPLAVHRELPDPRYQGEGRLLHIEYPAFHFFNVYFPNGTKDDGRLAYKMGYYDAFLAHAEELRAIGLDVPQAVELAQKLREKGFDVPEGIYKIEEVRAAVEAIVGKGGRHA